MVSPIFLGYQPHFLILREKVDTLSVARSEKFSGYILEACDTRINFTKCDEIIPLGFQETAGKFSIKRGSFDFSRGRLCNSSPVHFCAMHFIPDRSCLDVPVERKCSACNGLILEFLCELQHPSEAFSPISVS